VVGVAAPRAAPHHLHAVAGLDVLGGAGRRVEVLEELAERHAQRPRQARQRVEAGRRLAGLDLRQHAAADRRLLRQLGDGQPQAGAMRAQRRAEVALERAAAAYAGRDHPGIQSVPASGRRAIAAASSVSATRSSRSRWCTSDLPQARASVTVSSNIVFT